MIPITQALQFLIIVIANLYIFVLLLRVVLQFLDVSPYDPIIQAVISLTHHPLRPLNKIIPRIMGVDTPAVLLIIILEMTKLILLILLYGLFPPNFVGLLVWALGNLLSRILNLYFYVIIFRVVLSWLRSPKLVNIVYFLDRLTEPLLSPIRRVTPFFIGMDLSPIFAIIILQLSSILFIAPLVQLGKAMTLG